jgi:hypothetical protein
MEIFGVPVSEDTVKNTAVSGAVLLGLWQFVLSKLPWQSWLEKLLARFVPKPEAESTNKVVRERAPAEDDAAVNDALYTLRMRLKGDSQGQALVDSLASYWWKRGCSPKPVEPAT